VLVQLGWSIDFSPYRSRQPFHKRLTIQDLQPQQRHHDVRMVWNTRLFGMFPSVFFYVLHFSLLFYHHFTFLHFIFFFLVCVSSWPIKLDLLIIHVNEKARYNMFDHNIVPQKHCMFPFKATDLIAGVRYSMLECKDSQCSKRRGFLLHWRQRARDFDSTSSKHMNVYNV
jgi:hypothetical protein